MELLLYLKDFFGENLDAFKQDLYRSHSLKLVCERIVSLVTGGISASSNEDQGSSWQGVMIRALLNPTASCYIPVLFQNISCS